MTLYRCDVMIATSVPYVHRVRCPREAVWAGERDAGYGREQFFFCEYHAPSDWASSFDVFYRIKDHELVETGISKQNRELQECIETVRYDQAFMKGLKIKW